jgi:hypothetical protein
MATLTREIKFYSADTKSKHIIAYGDIFGKKRFKITYSDSRYFAHRVSKKAYTYIGEASSLEGAKNLCMLSIN